MSGIKDKKGNNNNEIPPTFYDSVPKDLTIDITTLNELIFERYQLLNDIFQLTENKAIRDNNFEPLNKIINQKGTKFDWNNIEGINNDISSHFFLALYLCDNESDIKWFINQETKLFRNKVNMGNYNMYKILQKLGVSLFEYKGQPNDELYAKIHFKTENMPQKRNLSKIFYCRWEEAFDLVRTHEFFLHKGNIFIPEIELPQLFRLVFERKLEENINRIKSRAKYIKQEARIHYIMNVFKNQKEMLSQKQLKELENNIAEDEKLRTAKEVDYFSERTFPLCMALIERHINQYSHLMHFGRLQYTLFLKGAGLPLEQSLDFFKQKYSKLCNEDKFNKEYAYNIRHSYGMEGKRADYTPYSCDKIIKMNTPMSRECHGCPFKTYNDEKMRQILSTCGIAPDKLEEVIAKKKNNEYQVACSRLFDAKFPNAEAKGVGIHPNSYFTSAMKFIRNNQKKNELNQKTKKNEENAKTDAEMMIDIEGK